MALCFFFLCLSACSAFCAARWERPFEDLLPISCGGILCILFCAGMAGLLKLGVVLIICLCALGWLLTLREIMGGGFARFRRAFFTPGFFLFLLFQVLFAFCLWGKLFDKTDELTHWGDIVRILCNLDAFGTAPGSNAQYASYPPGMALMQYFLQKLHCWRAGQPLAEWLCYYAYQVLLLAFLMPFCRRGRQDLLGYGLFAAVAFCLPLLFFSHYYESLLLDPFLGVLTGAGIGTVAWKKRRDWVYHATVLATCAVLVLAKDAGLLFAAGIAAMYVLEGWQAWSRKQRIGFSVGALSAVLLPKALWSWNVACSQVAVANQAEAVLTRAKNILCCDIHTRFRTKRRLAKAGAEKVLALDDLLTASVNGSGYNEKYGLLGSNKSSEDKVKLFPRNGREFVDALAAAMREATGRNIECMIYGDGAFKDPVGKIWELADPVVSPACTEGLIGKPNELKIKYLADNDFAGLSGAELRSAVENSIRHKDADLKGNMASQGTTPRQLTDLIGSLCDLTSGSGDKGTPVVFIQGYFDTYAEEE